MGLSQGFEPVRGIPESERAGGAVAGNSAERLREAYPHTSRLGKVMALWCLAFARRMRENPRLSASFVNVPTGVFFIYGAIAGLAPLLADFCGNRRPFEQNPSCGGGRSMLPFCKLGTNER